MLRIIAVISASVLATASCKSSQSQATGGQAGSAGSGSQAISAPPPPEPTTTLEQVQRSAPADVRAAPAGITVPGVELFLLTASKPSDDGAPAKLVGVVGGVGGKIVEGPELVRAANDGRPDRKTLARVALWGAQQDGDILDAPSNAVQRKAKVSPPAIKGETLTFWVWTTDVPRLLEKGRLDLSNGVLDLAPLAMSHADAIANAIATLAGVSVARHAAAIKALAAACAEPKAQQALLSALANHPRDRTRAAVADEVHKCGAAAVHPLINTMEHDRSAMVRTQAALALGRTGDSRARPALAKAARGEDANLAWAAKDALGKLK